MRKESKWFIIDELDFYPRAGITAKTIEEAWDKTLEKWRLTALHGKVTVDAIPSCGLCDKFNKVYGCGGCPIKKISGRGYCANTTFADWELSPSTANAKRELNFLYRVKRDTYKPKKGR